MEKAAKPLISIVIPVYKVEEYLDKCVESVINQTYENLEIILVDDGSPDKCPRMCDKWFGKDKRIRIIHKKNGGLSDARNAGIEKAKGEYISFIDSDDYIEPNYVEFLYDNLINENADISMGKHYVIYDKKTLNTGSGKKYIVDPHECFEKLLYGEDFDVSATVKLYKINLFDDIRYPRGRVYEDAATTYKLIDKARVIVLNSVPIYNYFIRENSISNNSFSERKFDLIKSTNEMCDYIVNKYPDLKMACERRRMYAYLSTLTQLAKSKKYDEKHKEELLSYIKEHRKEILKDKRICLRDRLGLISTYFGFGFYKFCWRFYSIIR